MQHLFVKYPLAVKLKEAGFTEPCIAIYSDGRLYPSVQGVGVLIGMLHQPREDYPGYELDDTVFVSFVPDIEDPNDIAAPIYQQVFDWLETRGLDIQWRRTEGGYVCIIDDFKHYMMYPIGEENKLTNFETKKQAWDTAIEKALELLKEKQ